MPESIRYLIAEVRECDWRTGQVPCMDDTIEHDYVCDGCRGDGTRVVVTDIEIKPDRLPPKDGWPGLWWEAPDA